MNIELKPIAESKVRQLGGDVCGVLVRKDQKLAAVDEHGRTTWLPDGTDYAAISSRAISDIATVTELLGVPEEEAGRPVVELVKEYLAAQSRNSVPNEQGKNRYGLDMAYFRNLFNRELNRPLVDFRPDELARVLARAARTADAAVLQEPEFQPARDQGGQGVEVVAWCWENHGRHVTVDKSFAKELIADGEIVRPLVYGDTQPQPAVPEGWKPRSDGPTVWEFRFVEALRNLCGGVEPPDRLVKDWLAHESDELQAWAVSNCVFHWAMGATVIDAAMGLADEPEEGAGHDLKRPQPPAGQEGSGDE